LLQGGFRSVDLIADACLVALIETGVPVWALDAERVAPGGLGIRTATELDAVPHGPGTIVIADAGDVHALLFGDPVPEHQVGPRTERVTLYSVSVDGVPAIHIEEALWICVDLLD
jgi:hypothetical protein